MDNAIISGLVQEFSEEFQIYGEETKVYEHLINYLIASRIQPEAAESAEQILNIDVDDGGTFGIDGMAFFVNGMLVANETDLSLYATSRSNEVNYIFIQTKTSPKLDVGEISKFARAVQNFFQKGSGVVENEAVRRQRKIKDKLFQRDFAKNNSKTSPICTLYFAFTGKNFNDKTVETVLEQERKNILSSCPEIKDVQLSIIDSDKVITLYNENTNSLEVDITFANRILTEGIPGVEETYSGFLAGKELFKLIEDEDGNIRKNIFYENVRDYLGDTNPVNAEIIKTLTTKEGQKLFPLLNNGITVIAKYIKPISGNSFVIKDYQIVNGCQTSNVIHRSKKVLDIDNFFVPIKIIYTNNSNVMEQIIRANNKQSVVPDEAFIALESFHKQLQEYYRQASKREIYPLYYERRSREISNDAELNAKKQQIVTLHSQIRSYVSVYLNEPHLVYSNNPTFILNSARTSLFAKDDCGAPYYTSSYIVFKIRDMLRTGKLNYKRYHNFVYYFAFLFRVFITGNIKAARPNNVKANETDKQEIMAVLANEKGTDRILQSCKTVIDNVLVQPAFKNSSWKDAVATTAFENAIRTETAIKLEH